MDPSLFYIKDFINLLLVLFDVDIDVLPYDSPPIFIITYKYT